MKKKIKRHLFSLVELMVVILIIGLLGGIVGMNVFKHVAEGKIAATRASIVEYSKSIDIYFMDTGKYPGTLEDLVTKPEGVKGWKGPYIRGKISDDAWHNPYVLNVTNEKEKPYVLFSCGPDGVEGGNDDIFEREDDNGSDKGSSSKASESPEQ